MKQSADIIKQMQTREATNGWSEWTDLCDWAGIEAADGLTWSIEACCDGDATPEARLLRALAGAGVRYYQPGGETCRFYSPKTDLYKPLSALVGRAP